jgi:hypothetical protein
MSQRSTLFGHAWISDQNGCKQTVHIGCDALRLHGQVLNLDRGLDVALEFKLDRNLGARRRG